MVQNFMNLPGPAKAGLAIAGGAGLTASLFMIVPREYIWLLVLAIALSALALLLYRSFLKWRDRERVKPFERRLAENSGATPQGVTDATRRARLDDLRRKFEEGITTFKEHGKDLYAMPWYLLVGEPGSGKTEAVRHCKVSFPPGLQDQLQGAGGTLNMNWWFTNHAVVLDTAGRLMFEEVEAGKSSEWREFLKMLRTARPNCPINGLLLVIPADSLIADSSDDIMHKAGRIAEQLDGIQRSLGVRFPAFVVITKCDLINGFREFFADLDDPTLQQQILGWSNPADLDAPFRPEQIEEHLREVAERLRERRITLLMDPVHTEDDLGGRRIDQVDALYSFPDSLLKISSRLKLYMETVFVAGEWSTKPLFLRGIYFTSSMQQGAELDAELADALGVDVKSLPEGSGFSRNTSLFLRDLFMNKVFREKGLVTAATNARKQQRNRRVSVAVAGVAATLALIGVTWFSGQSYSVAMGDPSRFWGDVASYSGEDSPVDLSLIREERGAYHYQGAAEVNPGGRTVPLVSLPIKTMEQAKAERSTPAVFRPVAALSGGNPFARQREAHEVIVRRVAVEPFVLAARAKLADEREWGADASRALAQLLRLEAGTRDEEGRVFEILPVARYVLARTDSQGEPVPIETDTADEIAGLQEVIDWTYREGETWPPPSLIDPDANVDARVGAFASRLADAGDSGGGKLGLLTELRGALDDFAKSELDLLARVRFPEAATNERFSAELDAWSEGFGRLERSHEALARAVARVESDFGAGATQDLGDTMGRARTETLDRARERFNVIHAEIRRARQRDEGIQRFEALEAELNAAMGTLEENVRVSTQGLSRQLQELGGDLLRVRRGADGAERAFDARFAMLKRADAELARAAEPATFENLATVLDGVRESGDEAKSRIARLLGPSADATEPATRAAQIAREAVDAAGRRRAAVAIGQAIDSMVDVEGGVRSLVRDRSRRFDPVLKPNLPFTTLDGGTFDADFHHEAAASMFGAADRIRQELETPAEGSSARVPLDAERLADRARVLRTRIGAYAEDYLRYWSVDVIQSLSPARTPRNWRDMHRDLSVTLDTFSVNRELLQAASDIRVAQEAARTFWNSRDEDAYRELERLIENLSSDARRYTDTLEDRIQKWQELTGDVETARERLLAETPPGFTRFYLSGVYDRRDPPVRYWSDLILASLRVLAESAEEEIKGDLRRFVESYRQFPITTGIRAELSPQAVFSAHADLVALLGAESPPARPETIGDGLEVMGMDEVNQFLGRVRGDGAIRSNDRRFLNERVLPALRWLRGDGARPELPEWELIVLPAGVTTAQQVATETVRSIEVVGGRGPGRRDLPSDRSAETRLWSSVHDEDPMNIRFWRFSDPQDPNNEVVHTFAFQRWTVLRRIFDGQAEPVDGMDGVWATPVRFDDNGRSIEYRIGFRFRRPGMPGLDSWPSAADWPVNPGGG